MAHTPTPWFVVDALSEDECAVSGGLPVDIVAATEPDAGATSIIDDLSKADAELIVRAVNCHAELLAFVKRMHAQHAPTGSRQRCLACGLAGNCCGTYLAADALLAKAEGR